MKKLTILSALAAFVITSAFTGCISVKRETEPTTSTVTTRTTQSSPAATTRTVERTTTQY